MDPLMSRVYLGVGVAYIVAAIILYLSIGADIECSSKAIQAQWKAFQRAGSAIVIIAILLGTLLYQFWYLPKEREVTRMTRAVLQRAPDYVREAIPEASQDEQKRVTEKATQDAEREINEIRDKIFGRSLRGIVIAELILVIVGTAIWGYGDLIPNLWGSC